MKYLKQFLIILAISFIGEILKYIVPLPIPASIYGMVIMFICLQTKILKLDEGFNSVFNRIKDDVQSNKARFKQPLSRLKELITTVTDLGVQIQAQELRNKQLVEKRFAQMRKELSNAKRATSKANAYYKNTNRLNNYESHFLDQKK